MKYKLNIEFQSNKMEEVTKLMENLEKMVRKEDHVAFSLKSDTVTDKIKRIRDDVFGRKDGGKAGETATK